MKYILIIIIISIFVISCNNSKRNDALASKTTITAEELKNKIDNDEILKIIDVRSESEFYGDVGHIEGSELIPLQTIAKSIKSLKSQHDEIFVVCLSGKRSAVAAKILRSNGIKALNVKGGMLAWNKLTY